MIRAEIRERDLLVAADLFMTILPYQAKYIALVGRIQDPIRLELRTEDLAALNVGFTRAAEALVATIEREDGSNEAVRQLLLDPGEGLASRGHAALNSLFGLRWKDVKRQLDTAGEFPMVEVRSDEFVVPWELLYDLSPGAFAESGSLEEVITPFWALNRVIGRQEIRERATDGLIKCHPLRVGLVVNEDLRFARREREMLETLAQKGRIALTVFEREHRSQWRFIEEMNVFLQRRDIDVFHFACHSEVNMSDPFSSYLEMSNGMRYYVSSFDQDPAVAIDAPLIFLNACATGIREPMQTFDFVRRFWRKGARNIVAVEAAIESRMAMEFSEKFYKRFVSGVPLGSAVLQSRREVALREGGTGMKILSLFYTLYADPALRVASD